MKTMNKPSFVDRIILKRPTEQGSYLKDIPAIRHFENMGEINLESSVTIFIGENGSGKSTLIEGIAAACGFNPEGGTKNYSFSTKNTHSELYKSITISRIRRESDGFFLRAESFYNVCTYLDELDSIKCCAPTVLNSYGGTSLHCKSHGQSFCALFENRFGKNGLYILDEPETGLSVTGQIRFILRMNELEKSGSQFIIATHSPILMTYPGAAVLELSESGIQKISFDTSEQFLLAKRILNCPERMYNRLFD